MKSQKPNTGAVGTVFGINISSGASHTDVCQFFGFFEEIWHVSLSWDILQIHQFVGTEVI